jgi:nitrogen fixation protein FixH
MSATSGAKRKQPREVTGRTVLLWLGGFFVFIFAVNAVMVRAAISTFGGVETTSSYKAGLQFGQELAAAHRQEALHWEVSGRIVRDRRGEAVLDVTARDAQGAPLMGLTARALLAHPADSRLDHVITVQSLGGGVFRGEVDAAPGQWELILDLYRGEDRVFRSRSRVSLATP